MELWVILLLAAIFIAVLGTTFLVMYLRKRSKMPTTAHSHTGRAAGPAARWARSNGFKVIAPAKLAGKGSFADLDALVIGYFGILGVKAYGYNGEIYGTKDDAEWLQVAPDGTRTYFKNPIDEASADVRVVRDALFAAKLKMIPVEVVAVFTNSKAQIAVPKSTGHYTARTFKDLLDKERFRADKGLDLEKVEKAIRAAESK